MKTSDLCRGSRNNKLQTVAMVKFLIPYSPCNYDSTKFKSLTSSECVNPDVVNKSLNTPHLLLLTFGCLGRIALSDTITNKHMLRVKTKAN